MKTHVFFEEEDKLSFKYKCHLYNDSQRKSIIINKHQHVTQKHKSPN